MRKVDKVYVILEKIRYTWLTATDEGNDRLSATLPSSVEGTKIHIGLVGWLE